MKKLYRFLSITLLTACMGIAAKAQMVGTNIYLPGHWLEIGQTNYGAFGAPTPPAGYFPSPAGPLAEVYDYGHDGWTTPAAVPRMGDYTYPGSPFEGWAIQVGAAGSGLNWALASNGSITGTGSLTGSNVSYVNSGGRLLGNWQGTAAAGQLKINMETRVDTNSSWVVMTVVMKNLGGSPLNNIYYLRSCDPDNEEAWTGSFTTNNWVSFQNDVDHRVQVSSQGTTYTTNAYMGIGTKDCRAKALVYSSWPIDFYVTDLSTVYSGSAGITPVYTVGSHVTSDIAIGLIYNSGTIPANDSTVISYAYIFNSVNGIDSAFPEPTLVVNNVPVAPTGAAPAPTIDTFNACLYPGLSTLPVRIDYASDKDWSWSTWTWSPATGLSSTTGVSTTVDLTSIPASITYTITGTDSAMNMKSCANRVMYLTVKTCRVCVNNSPCYGDTLRWNMKGDSTGATYVWYGPAPSTAIFSTLQSPFKYPATWADSGMYHCVKTTGGVHDTDSTRVIIRPKPNVTASSNSPLCQGVLDTLKLTSTTDVTPVTYSWTGPAGFTSVSSDPTLPGFVAADTGTYTLIVSSDYNCKDTATTHVYIAPPPLPPTVTVHTPYCQNDAFIPFTVTGVTGTVYWYPAATGGGGTTTAPVVNTAAPGTYNFYFSQRVGSCESDRDSVRVVVNPIPAPITGPSEVCQYLTITLSDATPGGTWSSGASAIASIDAATGMLTGNTPGTATIAYTLPTTCKVTKVITVHPKPAPPAVSDHNICQYTPTTPAMVPTGTGITWYGPGLPATGLPVPVPPSSDTVKTFTYHLTQTSAYGCISDSATLHVNIIAEPAPPVAYDTSFCQLDPSIPALTASGAPGSHLVWYTSSTTTTPLASAPVPPNDPYTWPVGTTWYVSQVVNGCESHRSPLNVVIYPKPQFDIVTRGWVCRFDSLKLSYGDLGQPLLSPSFYWTVPEGAAFVEGTQYSDSAVYVKFDTARGLHPVILTVVNMGRCATSDTFNMNVVAQPVAQTYCRPDLCQNDTVQLALSYITPTAHNYTWTIDGVNMASSPVVQMVSANSNSGGPFVINWIDSGVHIINVAATSPEGCHSEPYSDTVMVHAAPDASFTYRSINDDGSICLEDSVQFFATATAASYSYLWGPDHYFRNNNRPQIWGHVEEAASIVSLTVTTPFGCKATTTRELDPGACCTVWFPSAFSPNGDTKNDVFRPLFAGYHRFHSFRVVNRWGQVVHESANNDPHWDGFYNGEAQDMGTYYYFIKYDCGGRTIEAKGDVTLIR